MYTTFTLRLCFSSAGQSWGLIYTFYYHHITMRTCLLATSILLAIHGLLHTMQHTKRVATSLPHYHYHIGSYIHFVVFFNLGLATIHGYG